MDLSRAAVFDVRPLLGDERRELLNFLRGLSADDWARPSAAPGWHVKDLALHLLDDDLGRLSRDRDGDRTGLLQSNDHECLVAALAAKNQQWIDGAQGLSARVITELLEWSGQQVDAFCASIDLLGEGHVSWASDGPVPTWFDLARDLTERWVHQMQMREAVDRVEGYAGRYLPLVLRIFVWALPHQYRVDATAGTTIQIAMAEGGAWHLVCDGSARWSLHEGTVEEPDARISVTGDAAWRWLTGAAVPQQDLHLEGAPELCEPLLGVRGIIA